MSKKIVDIAEQYAVFDGKPDLMPTGLAINMLTYNAYGGTPRDLEEAKHYGLKNPRRYKVRLIVEIEDA